MPERNVNIHAFPLGFRNFCCLMDGIGRKKSQETLTDLRFCVNIITGVFSPLAMTGCRCRADAFSLHRIRMGRIVSGSGGAGWSEG
jgi:hypothetical protein